MNDLNATSTFKISSQYYLTKCLTRNHKTTIINSLIYSSDIDLNTCTGIFVFDIVNIISDIDEIQVKMQSFAK